MWLFVVLLWFVCFIVDCAILDPIKKKNSKKPFPSEDERRETTNKMARDYDDQIQTDEFFMGIYRMRKKLLKRASGSVLEIASGTGRNLKYYPDSCYQIQLLDSSDSMIEISKEKWKKLDKYQNISFQVGSAQNMKFKDNSFDTIVDTFGICSFEDPVKVLSEMRRVCKENGTILLLEHGQSSYTFLQNYQAKNLSRHVHNWGCYFNRDIEGLVKQAGLEIVEKKRYHFGTTYFIVAKPNKSTWKVILFHFIYKRINVKK